MAQIRILDQNMINMIAAGEVIERPASVVKELMENSIDAGATKIIVSIEEGGKNLISIADNGCGMDADDLNCAFKSHTTSKIKDVSDLRNISTLGFRGEALASIASISQIKAVSRTKNSSQANCIEIDCGAEADVTPCSADYGTKIDVRNIFYKLPARRRFLKTANTEFSHITEQFTRIALASLRSVDNETLTPANLGLDMTLLHNGRESLRLPAQQTIRRRIADLFSREISENLIETKNSERGLEIFALLGRADTSKINNKFQYIFLNGRFIRDRFISHAIKEAYRGCLEPNRYPVIFLFIKMPAENYDVNVHPAKTEVRFYNSNLVHSQILGAIREKLLSTNLDTEVKLPEPAGRSQQITEAMADFFKKHRPSQDQRHFNFPKTSSAARLDMPPAKTEQFSIDDSQYTQKFLQIHNSFIVTQTHQGFVIIDQHALHERMMYENLCKRIQAGKLESQKLLMPESFELSDAAAEVLKANSQLIEKLGIELVPFGPGTMAIQAFPTLLQKADPLEFISDLIDLLTEKGTNPEPQSMLDEVLNMAACKAAIKAGQSLTNSEMAQLLADKENFESTGRCPHGRPTTIKFSIAELEKQFKRT